MKTDIARTFAALNATNEAILYAKSPEELYAKVCEAAFSVGDFLAVAVFLLDPETNLLRFAAGFGDDVPRLRSIDISIVAGTPEGSGVSGQAFRDRKICVSNDFLNDPRSLPWREGAKAGQVGAAAALPLICNGESVGVLLVSRREPHSIDGQIVSMLERVSANISFALDNFDHEAARKSGERVMRRLNRMFGAISATNEAILRAKTEQELYQRVCDAAVHSGKSAATVVLLAEPDSIWLKPVAGTGAIVEQIMRAPFSIDAGNPYGTGVCGRAFRTQQPAVNNDILNSTQGQPWHQTARETGVTACVAVPLIKADESIGVLMFFVGKSVGGGRRDRRADGADRGERLVRAGQFRARRRKGESRCPEGTSGAHAGGAQCDQRSDRSCNVADGAVRTGMRSCREGRPVQLDQHSPGATGQRLYRYGGRGGADGRTTCAG